MQPCYTARQVRAAEQEAFTHTAADVVMQRAAFALATLTVRVVHQPGRTMAGLAVVVLAGAGNNGGDALFAGQLLAQRGAQVQALLLADRAHTAGVQALRRAGGRIHQVGLRLDASHLQVLRQAEVVLDGIVGLGAQPGLRAVAREVAQVLNALPGRFDQPDQPLPHGAGKGTVVEADRPDRFDRLDQPLPPPALDPCPHPPDRPGALPTESTWQRRHVGHLSRRPHKVPPAQRGRGPVVVAVDLPSGIDPDAGLTPERDAVGSAGAVSAASEVGSTNGAGGEATALASASADRGGCAGNADTNVAGGGMNSGGTDGTSDYGGRAARGNDDVGQGDSECDDWALGADHTVTFAAAKPGLVVYPGCTFAGQVHVVDIGLDLGAPAVGAPAVLVVQASDVAQWWPRLAADANKYTRGVLGVLAGSPAYPGAAVLAAGAALRTGVGMVRAFAAPQLATQLHLAYPEVVVHPREQVSQQLATGKVSAWAVGPGLGTDDLALRLAVQVLGGSAPVVLDADALTLLAAHPQLAQLVRQRQAPTLLTPHAGEMARLLADAHVPASQAATQPAPVALQAAKRYQATVLLKGPTTVIAPRGGEGQVWVLPPGPPRLATAGSGDVLTGMIGALLASGCPAQQAAAMAAYVHAQAGRCAYSRSPSSLLTSLAQLLASNGG